MTCDDCIHKSVCYRIDSVSPSYADKCGDFMHDNSIVPVKPMVEIDLYSVIKQKYIERDVLDKIRAEIDQITDTMGVSYNQYVSKIDVLQIIDKYREG